MLAYPIWSGLAAQVPSGTGSTSIFDPAGTPAHSIFNLSLLVLSITAAIFLVVGGLLTYALLRYRHRAGDANASQEPPQIYGSNQIELSWTVIPILIVVMLFLATARIILATQGCPETSRGVRRHRHRSPVLVGIPLSQARYRHGQRTAHPGQRS